MPEGTETIGRVIVEHIDARQSDGFVAIATQGEGVFTTHVGTAPNGSETNLSWSPHVLEFTNEIPEWRSFLRNLGTTDIAVDSVGIIGPDRSEFQVVETQSGQTAAFNISPGDSVWVNVAFKPDTSIKRYRLDTLIAYAQHSLYPVAVLVGFPGSSYVSTATPPPLDVQVIPELVRDGRMQIIAPMEISGEYHIDIYDPLGRLVLDRNREEGTSSLDVSMLSSGVYYLRLNWQNGMCQKSFRILK
jgi:hypothetical protein